MKPKYFASFDESTGIVIGVVNEHSEPVMWFQDISDFEHFLNLLQKFSITLPHVPDAFLKAFDET